MNFHQKLARLAEDRIKSKLAAKAGIQPTVLQTYLSRGSLPGIDIGIRLARALGVTLDWLADDSREWPPERIKESDDTASRDQRPARVA